jgi:hypothetical protein
MEKPARNTDSDLTLAEVAERLIGPARPRRLEVRGYFGDDLLVLWTGRPTVRDASLSQVNMEVPLLRRPSVCGSVRRAHHLSDIALQADAALGLGATFSQSEVVYLSGTKGRARNSAKVMGS